MFCDRCLATGEGAPRCRGLDGVAVEPRDGAAHDACCRLCSGVDLDVCRIELDRGAQAQLHFFRSLSRIPAVSELLPEAYLSNHCAGFDRCFILRY